MDLRSTRNILIKALGLFILANLTFAAWHPMTDLGRMSAYNHLFPGRQRLPYGDNPDRAYNLSLFNMEAMFASHEIAAGPKPAGEFRVILIGDSSTWGFLLPVDNTLPAYLNATDLQSPDGRQIKVFNLGYPVMSLAKDLLILSFAMRYEPDLIVWPLTLESFPYDKQLFSPLLQNNKESMQALIQNYGLQLDPDSSDFIKTTFWDKTIFGTRRQLADILRLQLYGVMWAATGIDQDIPSDYTPRLEDLPADESFHDLPPSQLDETDLAFDILFAGTDLMENVPILFINEPMFISQGENSHIRYNYFYPRWAYDEYRQLMDKLSQEHAWHYLDMWDAIAPSEFTNSAVHMSPKGTKQFAEYIAQAIMDLFNLTANPN